MTDETTIQGWAQELRELHSWMGRRFERAEPRARAYRYIQGLLSNVPRKNGWQWQLAELSGSARAHISSNRPPKNLAWTAQAPHLSRPLVARLRFRQ